MMTEELNGLFNPFYATAGTDMDIVGMTQIGMLTTDDNGNTTCGENEATVVLDYEISESNGNCIEKRHSVLRRLCPHDERRALQYVRVSRSRLYGFFHHVFYQNRGT